MLKCNTTPTKINSIVLFPNNENNYKEKQLQLGQ